CATSGTARLTGIFASRCSPTHQQRPAQAAACAGAFSFMPLDPMLRQIDRSTVSAIIPCLNEETAIGPCVAAMVALGLGEVIVVDGGSTDLTVARATEAGASVLIERRRGYGRAMLSGLAAISPAATIVLFIDGDGSDPTEMIPAVLEPIEQGTADFVLGSRLGGRRERGSLDWPQLLAGGTAGAPIHLRYYRRFTARLRL